MSGSQLGSFAGLTSPVKKAHKPVVPSLRGIIMDRHRTFRLLVSFLLCTLLVGCNGKKAEIAKLRAFLQEPRSEVAGTEYRVLPPDVIEIHSQHVPEISGLVQRVRPDGKINLPLLGEIYVAGHTPREIEQALTEAARDYYDEVDATVKVVGYNSQRLYVFGQVLRPGPISWTGTNTLLDVLAQVQPTELAWPERIKVVRAHPPVAGGYVPGTEQTASQDESAAEQSDFAAQELTIDMKAMVETGDFSHNILLQPYDVVYVPPNPFAAVGLGLRTILFPTRPVLEAVSIPARMENVTAP